MPSALEVLMSLRGESNVQPILNDLTRVDQAISQVAPRAAETVPSLDAMGSGLGRVSEGTGNLSDRLTQTMSTIDQFRSALEALSAGLGGFLIKSTLTAGRTDELGLVLDIVGRNAGYAKKEVEGYVEAVKKQGITTQEARQAVTRMIQVQLDLGKAAQLARAMQDAAVIAGTNSSQAFQSAIHAIITQQPEIMRMYGINISMQEAMAAAGGKNARSMTAQAKQQAMLNLILEKAKTISGAYEASMNSATKQLRSLTRYIEETMNIIGERFLPLLKLVQETLTDIFAGFTKAGKPIQDFVSYLIGFISIVFGLRGGLRIVSDLFVGLGQTVPVLSQFGGVLRVITPYLPTIAAGVLGLSTAIKFLGQESTVALGSDSAMARGEAMMSNLGRAVNYIRDRFWELQKVFEYHYQIIMPVLSQNWERLRNIVSEVSDKIQEHRTFLEFLASVWNTFARTLETAIYLVNQALFAFEEILRGDWTGAWNIMKDAGLTVLALITTSIEDIISKASDWGWNLIVTLANGMIDAAETELVKALTDIGNAVADFFEGMSPPRKGPLSHIDTWGRNVAMAWGSSFKETLSTLGPETAGMIASSLQNSGTSVVNIARALALDVVNAFRSAQAKRLGLGLNVATFEEIAAQKQAEQAALILKAIGMDEDEYKDIMLRLRGAREDRGGPGGTSAKGFLKEPEKGREKEREGWSARKALEKEKAEFPYGFTYAGYPGAKEKETGKKKSVDDFANSLANVTTKAKEAKDAIDKLPDKKTEFLPDLKLDEKILNWKNRILGALFGTETTVPGVGRVTTGGLFGDIHDRMEQGLGPAIVSAINDSWPVISEAFGYWKEHFFDWFYGEEAPAGLGGATGGRTGGVLTRVNNLFNDLTTSWNEAAPKAWTSMKDAFKHWRDQFFDWFYGEEAPAGLGGAGGGRTGGVLSKISILFNDFIPIFKTEIKNAWTNIREGFNYWKEHFFDWFFGTEVEGGGGKRTGGVVGKIQTVMDMFATGISDSILGPVWETVSEALKTLWTDFANFMFDKEVTEGGEVIVKAGFLSTMVDNLVKASKDGTLRKQIEDIGKSIGSTILDAITSAFTLIIPPPPVAQSSNAFNMPSSATILPQEGSQLFRTAQDIIGKLFDALYAAVSIAGTSILRFLTGFLEGITAQLQTDEGRAVVRGIGQGLVDAIIVAIGLICSGAEHAARLVASLFPEALRTMLAAGDLFATIGASLATGIIEGIYEALTGKEMSEDFKRKLEDALRELFRSINIPALIVQAILQGAPEGTTTSPEEVRRILQTPAGLAGEAGEEIRKTMEQPEIKQMYDFAQMTMGGLIENPYEFGGGPNRTREQMPSVRFGEPVPTGGGGAPVVGGGLLGALERIKSLLQTDLPPVMTSFREILTPFTDQILKDVTPIWEIIEDIYSIQLPGIIEQIKETIPKASETMVKKMTVELNKLHDPLHDVWAWLDRILTAVIDIENAAKRAAAALRGLGGETGEGSTGQQVTTAQHGLSMIVPSGFSNDSFLIKASSGELVNIIPASLVRAMQRVTSHNVPSLNSMSFWGAPNYAPQNNLRIQIINTGNVPIDSRVNYDNAGNWRTQLV